MIFNLTLFFFFLRKNSLHRNTILWFQCEAFYTGKFKSTKFLVFPSYLHLIFYSEQDAVSSFWRVQREQHSLLSEQRTRKIKPYTLSYLKREQWDYNCHPADCHCYVRPPLLSDHIHGAQEQNRPHNVIEHHKTQKGHQDPQWNANNLKDKLKKLAAFSTPASDAFVFFFFF